MIQGIPQYWDNFILCHFHNIYYFGTGYINVKWIVINGLFILTDGKNVLCNCVCVWTLNITCNIIHSCTEVSINGAKMIRKSVASGGLSKIESQIRQVQSGSLWPRGESSEVLLRREEGV